METWARSIISENGITNKEGQVPKIEDLRCDLQFFDFKNQAAYDRYVSKGKLHHDLCEKLIIVYVTLKNHSEGSIIASVSNRRTDGDLLQNPYEYYTLKNLKDEKTDELQRYGVAIDDFHAFHGSPNINAEVPTEPIRRVMFRIKVKAPLKHCDSRQYHVYE